MIGGAGESGRGNGGELRRRKEEREKTRSKRDES